MRAFLEESIEKIQSEYSDISKLIIVLPSKRAGGFLKNYLRKQTSTPFFAPQIISIEEFIQELANLKIISSEELLLKCYKAYSSITEIENKETFENFTAWATTLLNDFNEIDRYLIDPKSFFSYLSSIKTLEKWGAEKEQTPLIDDFLKFWNHIHLIYDNLNHELLSEGIGYQGMVYRKASEDIEHYLHNKGNLTHIFIGFNALNKAEEHIIQELLEVGNSQIFWDIDAYFYNDPEHSSSIFIRNYLQHWKYYDTQSTPTFSEIYQRPKTIQIVEAQNNIQQAKYLGALLESLSEETLDETAIVLADESLLMPVLYSLPSNVKSANITMGAPLESFNIVHFFNTLFKLQLKKGSYYYSNVAALLNHPFSDILLKSAKHILSEMNRLNISHISAKKIKSLAPEEEKGILELLFDPWNQQSTQALQSCLKLIELAQIEELSSQAEKIALRKLEGLFLKIQTLIERNDYLKELVSFQSLFAQLIAQDSLDFEGDAYDGLQIMGVLETRVLDFKNVIFLSVNEGFLPAGRSNASYITSDLKKQFELPFYTEKDAIYAYHFYRLLQRAENITLLYNGQGKGLSASEKSRFIMQIEVDNLKQHQISHKSLSASFEARESGPREIEKS
ncbi:MAG: PD-(D/E)XK nuclease family protein, partial [Flavobacteriaceae bacterium]|nr:PD-(D/E)XK nuclease family protein [Flavobacteriaceae bacterium]